MAQHCTKILRLILHLNKIIDEKPLDTKGAVKWTEAEWYLMHLMVLAKYGSNPTPATPRTLIKRLTSEAYM